MQATKDHISLETAKLLKDCGIESKYWFIKYKEGKMCWDVVERDKTNPNEWIDFAPAFTWGEILWITPKKLMREKSAVFCKNCKKEVETCEKYFHGELEEVCTECGCYSWLNTSTGEEIDNNFIYLPNYLWITDNILTYLRLENYDEADLYFRENTILIKK